MSDRARLVLVTPSPSEGAEWPGSLPQALAAALSGGRVDAVVLRLPAVDERTLVKLIKPLAPIVQDAGAALLLEDAPAIVARAGADGVHLSDPARVGRLSRCCVRTSGSWGRRACAPVMTPWRSRRQASTT